MVNSTIFAAGTASSLALMPLTLVVGGRGRMSTGDYAMAGLCVVTHQEKSGFTASNAQTTDLREIPPRGSAPV